MNEEVVGKAYTRKAKKGGEYTDTRNGLMVYIAGNQSAEGKIASSSNITSRIED